MQETLKRAKEVAVQLAREAGQLAKAHFGQEKRVSSKDEYGDFVTEIDEKAEKLITQGLRSHFPTHRIRGEEFGWSGEAESDWVWLVDPLDGTNNYAIGLPLYGVSITCIYQGEPLVGVIYDSHLEKMVVAQKGKGVTCNGVPFQMKPKVSKLPTFAWIQGHQVQNDPTALHLKQHLDEVCKRVLRLWAPTLVWCMLARGDLDGVVLYNSEGEDLYAGLLIAREAGAITVDYDGNPFVGMNQEPYILACHPSRKEEYQQIVQDGLRKE